MMELARQVLAEDASCSTRVSCAAFSPLLQGPCFGNAVEWRQSWQQYPTCTKVRIIKELHRALRTELLGFMKRSFDHGSYEQGSLFGFVSVVTS